MTHPTTRVLALLEMLQARGHLSGPEIADQLHVDVRTVRHYVNLLLDIGVPVETIRGRYGGYRLLPGYKLPPMMFTEGEALALLLGLKAAERLGLTVAAPATAGARAKLERVLPAVVREKVDRTMGVVTIAGTSPYEPPQSEVFLLLSTAAQQQRQVTLRHRSWRAEETERTIAPYGVVNYQGRWFVAGHCLLRDEMRVFRVDRIAEVIMQSASFVRPADFDCLACVLHSLATTPGTWLVEVQMKTHLERARQCISPAMGLLEETDNGVQLRCWVQSLSWLAHVLAGLDWECVIQQPPELREAMHQLAAKAAIIGNATGTHEQTRGDEK